MLSNYRLYQRIASVVGIMMLDIFMMPVSNIAASHPTQQNVLQPEKSLSKMTKLYVPPPDEGAPKTATRPTGRRNGCTSQSETVFRAFAPHQHIGRTHTTRPTFAWYIPDEVVLPIQFQLYRGQHNDKKSPPIFKYDLESSQGLRKISIPEDRPELSIGEKYWWQVILFCEGRSRPASSIVIRAKLAVIAPSKPMLSKLATAQSSVERSKIFAAFGFWYDALAEVSEGRTFKERQTKNHLLEDLDLLEGNSTVSYRLSH